MKNGKWNAEAEMCLMGSTIPVEGEEHCKYLIAYVLKVLGKDASADEVFAEAHKFNSENTPISHLAVNDTAFGTMLTFVRDDEMDKLDSENGVLAYVYNVDCPFCSELGYVFFKYKNGRYVRCA